MGVGSPTYPMATPMTANKYCSLICWSLILSGILRPPPPRLNDQIAAVVCPEVALRQSVLQRAEVTNNRGAKPSARFTTMQLAQQKEMRLLPVTKSLYPNIAMHCVAISSSCQLCSSYDSCCRFNQDWSILGF